MEFFKKRMLVNDLVEYFYNNIQEELIILYDKYFIKYEPFSESKKHTIILSIYYLLISLTGVSIMQNMNNRNVDKVLNDFRNKFEDYLSNRFQLSEDIIRENIIRMGESNIIHINSVLKRESNHFDWTKNWFKSIDIEENNPAILFELHHYLCSTYIRDQKIFKKFKVTELKR